MFVRRFLLPLFALIPMGVIAAPQTAKTHHKVGVSNGWITVDGEPFLVKGVCYFENHGFEGGGGGPNPPEVIDYEFRQIKEAGFNTVKTYLTPEALEAARRNGLMVVQLSDFMFFNDDYRDPQRLNTFYTQIQDTVSYTQRYDNVLYYWMDNEPNIQALYERGEAPMEGVWREMNKRVKAVDPTARTCVQMMPPTAFADVSMCDIASLNLYPFCPAANNIGYSQLADWYRRRRAVGKPFVISEYGWTDDVGSFGPKMTDLLDQQLKAGASGSFLYVWRTWGKEKEGDNTWWGVIPNDGKPEDYRNKPRSIYSDLRTYFEAVAVEPKVGGVYAKILPLSVYGTDATARVMVNVGDHRVSLKRCGKYWWKGDLKVAKEMYGSQVVSIEARDALGATLVRKAIPVYLCAHKETLGVHIRRETLSVPGVYRAAIDVVDGHGKPRPGVRLALGYTQSAIDPWVAAVQYGVTDSRGVYEFAKTDARPGFFTLMAGVADPVPGVETEADVDMARIDR